MEGAISTSGVFCLTGRPMFYQYSGNLFVAKRTVSNVMESLLGIQAVLPLLWQ